MSLFTVLATSKVAAGLLAAGAVTVGGSGVAAFAGALPADLQQKAHELIGAPAPAAQELAGEAGAAKAKATDAAGAAAADAQEKAADSADGAEATAADAVEAAKAKIAGAVAAAKAKAADVVLPESFGLCKALLSGGLNADAKVPGYESLVVAAGGEANVDAHCEEVVAGVDAQLEARGTASAEANTGANASLPAVPAVPAIPAAPGAPAVPAVPAVPGTPAELPGKVGGLADSVRP